MFKERNFEKSCTKNCRDAVGLALKLEGAEPTRRGSRSKLRSMIGESLRACRLRVTISLHL